MQKLARKKDLQKKKTLLKISNGTTVATKLMVVVNLLINDNFAMTLDNILYVPDAYVNIFLCI